jgi:hypothetical protein
VIAVSDPGARHPSSFRIAAFNFLNHALNSFGTGYAQQTSLTLNGTTTANAAYSPSSGFGFALSSSAAGCWKCQQSSPSDIRVAAEALFRKPPPERSHGHIAPSPLL